MQLNYHFSSRYHVYRNVLERCCFIRRIIISCCECLELEFDPFFSFFGGICPALSGLPSDGAFTNFGIAQLVQSSNVWYNVTFQMRSVWMNEPCCCMKLDAIIRFKCHSVKSPLNFEWRTMHLKVNFGRFSCIMRIARDIECLQWLKSYTFFWSGIVWRCLLVRESTHWIMYHVICSFSLKTNLIWLHAMLCWIQLWCMRFNNNNQLKKHSI